MKSILVFLLLISLSLPSAALVEEFLEDRFIGLQSQINEYCTKDSDSGKQSHCFSFMLKPEVTTSLLQGQELEALAVYWESAYADEMKLISEAEESANQDTERAQIEFSQCTGNANSMNGSTAENNARRACFESFKDKINFEQCSGNANAMNGTTAENNARRACFESLKHRMNFDQCSRNANSMNGTTAENNARRACFYFFNRQPSFTFDQCINNANRMNGATAENRMRAQCAEAFN